MYIQAPVGANIYFSLLSQIFGCLNLIVAVEQGTKSVENTYVKMYICMTVTGGYWGLQSATLVSRCRQGASG